MYGVLMAFKDYRINLGVWGSPWAGFKYFIKFFNTPDCFTLISNTIILNVYNLVFYFPIPIVFALLLNEVHPLFYKKLIQTVSYLPHFVSLPAVIGIMVMMLSPTDGIVNRILISSGLEKIFFMAEPGWFRPLYIISEVWTGIGWGAIIYIASLSNVNPELYESAALDGATRVKMVWHISLPCIMPTVVIMFLLQAGKIMSVGTERVLLMQTPYNMETSDVISTYVYRMGLEQAQYSLATAVGMFNSIVNILILTFANKMAKKLTATSLW